MNRTLLSAPRYLSQIYKFQNGCLQSKSGLTGLFINQLRRDKLQIVSSYKSTYNNPEEKKGSFVKQATSNLSTSARAQLENPLVGASATGSLKEAVEVQWKNGETTHYPYLWLRDNCYCPKCKKHGRDVFQRDFLMQDLNPESVPKDVKVGFITTTKNYVYFIFLQLTCRCPGQILIFTSCWRSPMWSSS